MPKPLIPIQEQNTRARVPESKKDQLKITECFVSLQGESTHTGLLTTFIRLTGCPLRCTYCDSEYAFFGGEWQSIQHIMDSVRAFGAEHICVTGGEPLAQRNCLDLLTQLCDAQYKVSLETSGALDIRSVDARVHIVMDVKTPASGESERNKLSNLSALKPSDEIKFVVSNREDYNWVKTFIHEQNLTTHTGLLISPDYEHLSPTQLANWVVEDRLPARFQIQLHKLLWGDQPGV